MQHALAAAMFSVSAQVTYEYATPLYTITTFSVRTYSVRTFVSQTHKGQEGLDTLMVLTQSGSGNYTQAHRLLRGGFFADPSGTLHCTPRATPPRP